MPTTPIDDDEEEQLDHLFEDIQPEPPAKAPPKRKRKPGGQPGNQNATQHGFYSKLIHLDEKKSLEGESLGELNDEKTMLRALLYRTIKYFDDNPPATFNDHVRSLRAVTLAIACLQGLVRTQKYAYNGNGHTMGELMQQAMQQLASIPPDED